MKNVGSGQVLSKSFMNWLKHVSSSSLSGNEEINKHLSLKNFVRKIQNLTREKLYSERIEDQDTVISVSPLTSVVNQPTVL